MTKKIRLDKYLVHIGEGTRSSVQSIIKSGKVLVNDTRVIVPDFKVDLDKDVVKLNNKIMEYEEFYYFVMNKPMGVITATEDDNHKTVCDLLDEKDRNKGIVPVGRLDKDTEGLIILTNDRDFNHKLLSPKKNINKVYYAKVNRKMADIDITRFENGINIGDIKCMPAVLEIIEDDKENGVYITLQEGKFHQVKRMVKACDNEVLYLERIKIGELNLPSDIKRGEYRKLKMKEMELLVGSNK